MNIITRDIPAPPTTTSSPAAPIYFSLFNNMKQNQPSALMGWRQLIATAENPSHKPKTEAQCIAAHSSSTKTKAAVLSNDAMTLCWIDLDGGNKSLSTLEVEVTALGIESAIIYSTASSQADNKKWRVLIELSTPLACDKWIRVQKSLASKLGGDDCATRIQQILFLPNIPESNAQHHYEQRIIEGDALGAEKLEKLALFTVAIPKPPQPQQKQAEALPDGQIDVFKAFNDQHPIGVLMLLLGYVPPSYDGGKWCFAASESGIAGVVVENNRMYSHHDSDPLSGKSLDSFDLMKELHGFTQGEAVMYAAKNALVNPDDANSLTVDQHNKKAKKDRETTDFFADIASKEASSSQPEDQVTKTAVERLSPLSALQKLSCSTRYNAMKLNMRNDSFMVPQMALQGQITLFYAKPNSGKTLLMLHFIIEAIKADTLKGEDVFYLNADDNYGGLTTKAGIAQEYGFWMISPSESLVSSDEILMLLNELAASDDAAGKLIVIDTLKKFSDVMNKKVQKDFFELLRRLVAKNTTVIILGHANKNLSDEGDLIYEGTADTLNDVDAAYSMYVLSRAESVTGEKSTIEFRNEKSRGNLASKVQYSYEKSGGSYKNLIDSVSLVSDEEANKRKEMGHKTAMLEQYKNEIAFLDSVLTRPLNQSQIIGEFDDAKRSGLETVNDVRRNNLTRSLTDLDGVHLKIERGDRNAKLFSVLGKSQLLPPKPPKQRE